MLFTLEFIKRIGKRSLSSNSLGIACLTAFFTMFCGISVGMSSSHAKGNPPHHTQAGGKPPIVLQEHGQFWAGGQVMNSTAPGNEDDLILVGQAYVEYFLPQTKGGTGKPPVIMTHTSINSTIFLTTPDGREGWVDFFVRRGYPVYIIDPPGTGRAGFPVGQFERVRAGLDDPSTLPSLSQRDSSSWENENMGPEFGVHGAVDPTCIGNDGRGENPITCHGWRMPNDMESLKQWLAHGLPQGGSAISVDSEDAFLAVLERIGEPVIWLGWSAGGSFGGNLVNTNPELFELLIGVEPSNHCLYDPGFVPTPGSIKIPALSIHGVNQIGRPSQPGRLSRADCEAIYDAINVEGGDATYLSLLDIGIFGSGHMMFWEDNSDEIAQVLLEWIEEKARKHHDNGHGKGHGKHHGKHHGKDHGQLLKKYIDFLKTKFLR